MRPEKNWRIFTAALSAPLLVAAAAEAIDEEIIQDLEFFRNLDLVEFSVIASQDASEPEPQMSASPRPDVHEAVSQEVAHEEK